jgi:hypothetical protein
MSSAKVLAFIGENAYVFFVKTDVNRPIPTLASNLKLFKYSGLQQPETASASESASEISIGVPPLDYPETTRQSLGHDGIRRPSGVVDTLPATRLRIASDKTSLNYETSFYPLPSQARWHVLR